MLGNINDKRTSLSMFSGPLGSENTDRKAVVKEENRDKYHKQRSDIR